MDVTDIGRGAVDWTNLPPGRDREHGNEPPGSKNVGMLLSS
jgi:hypothetical protein